MKTVILGGTGFIGRNLRQLLDDAISLGRCTGLDLREFEPSRERIARIAPKVIYNLAAHTGSLRYVAEHHRQVMDDNVRMSLNVYRIADSLPVKPKIINAYSNCSYPGHSGVQCEANWLAGEVHPTVLSFGNSRRALYHIAQCYPAIETANLIFPNAFGLWDHTDPQRTHAMSGMIVRMLDAKRHGDSKFEIWGSGAPIREWIYSADFARALWWASQATDLPPLLNVAQGRGYSIRESAGLIQELCDYPGELVFNTAHPDGDPIKVMDDTLFRQTFPQFVFTDHRTALAETIKYYEQVLS